jgi:2-polyprenyl-3-methyl-5-hydroxy-6-metoxy-1,4-benzoquinol methylase
MICEPNTPLQEAASRESGAAPICGSSSGEVVLVKQVERAWHDAFYLAHALEAYPETLAEFRLSFERTELTPFCEGGGSWWADLRKDILISIGEVHGLRILDYGCGYGHLGIYLASRGAQVCGFDFSTEAIKKARHTASQYGLAAQFDALDAEDLSYSDNSFDLAIGFGVLHHVVKYPRAGAQLWRVLKPQSKAFFHETLWDNPFINLARRFTTEHAQAGDAPLNERNVREFGKQFSQVQLEKHHLFYMLKRLARIPGFDPGAQLKPRPLWKKVKSLDSRILQLPVLRRYCGEVVVTLQK